MFHTGGLTCQRLPKWYFVGPRWRFCMFSPVCTLQYKLNSCTPYLNQEKHQNVVRTHGILPEMSWAFHASPMYFSPSLKHNLSQMPLSLQVVTKKIEHARTKINTTRWEATQGVTATSHYTDSENSYTTASDGTYRYQPYRRVRELLVTPSCTYVLRKFNLQEKQCVSLLLDTYTDKFRRWRNSTLLPSVKKYFIKT